MLLEIAVGDAYGAAFEYADELVDAHNRVERYLKHPRHSIQPGCYTDDTQMSLAIAEAIVEDVPWEPTSRAQKFVDAFHRDPREGYAQGFYHFLRSVQSGREFVERIRPESDKSGAAMRAMPIGVFPTVEIVIDRARVQARLTHDTPDGTNAAIASALMTHYLLYQLGPKCEVGKFVAAHVPGQWDVPWKGKVKSKGWMSVRAAMTAICRSHCMSELLKACIDFRGDVDTVAAIALGAASSSTEMEQDLPQSLVSTVENGPYGRDYLLRLDEKLMCRLESRGKVST